MGGLSPQVMPSLRCDVFELEERIVLEVAEACCLLSALSAGGPLAVSLSKLLRGIAFESWFLKARGCAWRAVVKFLFVVAAEGRRGGVVFPLCVGLFSVVFLAGFFAACLSAFCAACLSMFWLLAEFLAV